MDGERSVLTVNRIAACRTTSWPWNGVSSGTRSTNWSDKIMGNHEGQLAFINEGRTRCMEKLAETISAINADTEEMNEKDEEKRDLEEEYDETMAKFGAKCEEILFTKICAVRKVRNELRGDSSASPPSKMSDCDFTD